MGRTGPRATLCDHSGVRELARTAAKTIHQRFIALTTLTRIVISQGNVLQMAALTGAKLAQAQRLVSDAGVDVWLTFVRETAEGGDPVLPLILDGGLTWQSALLVTRKGERVAIVGNYDADPLKASGDWTEVVPYVQGIRQPLLDTLDRVCGPDPKIAVNFSTNDVKADGLSHGMYLLLERYLAGTRFEGTLVSAESIVMALRSQKTPEEVARMRRAIAETDVLFDEIGAFARIGVTEREVYDHVQGLIRDRGFGFAWDPAGDPIVNSGPHSMIGHGIPSETIKIEPGHVFHVDLGIIVDGYSSDIQRCWYVPESRESGLPPDVVRAAEAVNGAITAGAQILKPGVEGWQVDKAARDFLVSAGYEEYMHALGHQVGRVAHDGGAILGPKWERYGRTPMMPVQKDQVYTLELGVILPDRGYLGIEEMVVVTDTGCEFLSNRQMEIRLLGGES
jgi:Xaa-Pro dipeptidase